jgi:hypothetical protein
VTTVELDPVDPNARGIWRNALDLMGQLEGDWTLIGGLMVQLHAERYGGVGARPTNDIDILANSRTRPSYTERTRRNSRTSVISSRLRRALTAARPTAFGATTRSSTSSALTASGRTRHGR